VEHLFLVVVELESLQPNVALLDLPKTEKPLWIQKIGLMAPATRVLALKLANAEGEIVAWAESGITGYLNQNTSLEDLIKTIKNVAQDETPCHPRTTTILLQHVAAEPAAAVSTW